MLAPNPGGVVNFAHFPKLFDRVMEWKQLRRAGRSR
jgi:hypothetical protein